MNTEHKETLQGLLRSVMRLIADNTGAEALQRIQPILEEYQTQINKILNKNNNLDGNALCNIINNMSI